MKEGIEIGEGNINVFSLYIKSLPPYLSLSLSQNMVKK
jgi:hypothetical protein